MNKIYKSLFRLVWKTNQKYIIFLFFSSLISGILPIFVALTFQEVLNGIQLHSKFRKVVICMCVYILFEVFKKSFNAFCTYYKNKFQLAFDVYINRIILEKIGTLKLKVFESSETYDLINMIQQNGSSRIISFFEAPVDIVVSTITGVSFFYNSK